MTFMTDVHELKPGLIIYRRTDVKHRNWYCRIKLPKQDRYKRISLEIADINEARSKAFHHEVELHVKVRHHVPVFEKSFGEVALEYSAHQKRVSEIGQITKNRWKTIDGHVRLHLIPYMGNLQVTIIGDDKWSEYPFWRKKNNAPLQLKKHPLHKTPKAAQRNENEGAKNQSEAHKAAKDGTIRQEMMTFRAIMKFAAKRKYIPLTQVPDGDMPEDNNRREAFTAAEYKALHTYARNKWIDKGETALNVWYRNMAYQFMLVMTNTGMRNSEARNLKWRDIDPRKTKGERPFVVLNVRGKKKYRHLIAASNVAEYLERIRVLFIEAQKRRLKNSQHTDLGPKPDDFVFTTADGKGAKSLYDTLIADLLEKSGLLYSSSGSRRSIYSFRHTYATFRLAAGTDSYFLAKQMGTSVKMIEDHYGHVVPDENAGLLLQGIPEWELVGEVSGGQGSDVNADAAGPKAKPRAKRKSGGKDLRTAGKASRSTRRR